MSKPQLFVTEAEIDASVPVTPAGVTAWRWVYRLQLPPLLEGDILQVTANAEIRNDAGINVEFVGNLSLCPGWPYYSEDLWGVMGAPGPAFLLSKLNGTDIDPMQHYYIIPEIEAFRMPCAMPTAWLHYRIRCRSTAATGGQACAIMPGYGRMTCLLWQ